jgi:hypothetical protein
LIADALHIGLGAPLRVGRAITGAACAIDGISRYIYEVIRIFQGAGRVNRAFGPVAGRPAAFGSRRETTAREPGKMNIFRHIVQIG